MTTILTLGGGGFSVAEELTPIDRYLLDLTGKQRPRVCFVPTASGDADVYVDRFHRAFDEAADTSVVSLFNRFDPWTPVDHVLDVDVVYVGGGSTANLLAVWRLHGLDVALRKAGERGVLLAGISAGMNCWYEGSSTDSFGSLDPLPDGLGFLPGSACPHYDGEEHRRASYQQMVRSGALPDGHAVCDDAALRWQDGVVVEAVAERAGAKVFRVTKDGESEIPVRLLG